jgi:hypothetical protein
MRNSKQRKNEGLSSDATSLVNLTVWIKALKKMLSLERRKIDKISSSFCSLSPNGEKREFPALPSLHRVSL